MPSARSSNRSSSGRQLGVPGLPRQHAGAAHPSPAPVAAAGGRAVRLSTAATLVVRPVPRASTKPRRRGGTVGRVSPSRRCSRTACDRPAVTTLTYVYADQTAVLGPLATYAEPHAYDLCDRHAERLSAPRGWEVLRLVSDLSPRGPPTTTCSPWPTRSARRPARCRRPRSRRRAEYGPRDPPPRAPAGAHPRRGAGLEAPRPRPCPNPDTVTGRLQGLRRPRAGAGADRRAAGARDRPGARPGHRGRPRSSSATTCGRARRGSPGPSPTGATEAGADVVMIGLASTDKLYFASGHLGVAGAMFTASHNPAQYNGIKLCRANAVPLGLESGLDEIRDLVVAPRRTAGWPARASAASTCSWPTPSTWSRWCRCRRPPAQGRGRRRQRHGRPHRARGLPATGRGAGRAGADVLRARRHLPQPRGEPDRAGQPPWTSRTAWSARAPTSGWPSTATPTAASWSTSRGARSRRPRSPR